MGQMADSWDEEVQTSLSQELLREWYDDEQASLNDRRPYPSLQRQPDLILLDESGQASRYAYLLQPVETTETFFRQLQDVPEGELDVFVPLDKKTQVEGWIDPADHGQRILFYRITCGVLSVFE